MDLPWQPPLNTHLLGRNTLHTALSSTLNTHLHVLAPNPEPPPLTHTGTGLVTLH